MRAVRFTVFALLLSVVSPYAQQGEQSKGWRKLGDRAPALNLEFVRGTPITLEEGLGKNVFIVEFWATWCGPCKYSIPHLTELQRKHGKDGLVVIGISEEPVDLIKPYVLKKGDEMAYRVASDRMSTTRIRFTDGFGTDTNIPKAFVVDSNGRVAWIGNPLNKFMDEIVETLLSDIPEQPDDEEESSADAPTD